MVITAPGFFAVCYRPQRRATTLSRGWLLPHVLDGAIDLLAGLLGGTSGVKLVLVLFICSGHSVQPRLARPSRTLIRFEKAGGKKGQQRREAAISFYSSGRFLRLSISRCWHSISHACAVSYGSCLPTHGPTSVTGRRPTSHCLRPVLRRSLRLSLHRAAHRHRHQRLHQ